MTKRYTLFLDESETHKHDPMTHSDSDYHFCMAGVIVAEDDYAQLKNSVNQLKRKRTIASTCSYASFSAIIVSHDTESKKLST